MSKDSKDLEVEKLVEAIASRVEFDFDSKSAKEFADDIRHSLDGFMAEENIGAMIVYLISELTKEELQ